MAKIVRGAVITDRIHVESKYLDHDILEKFYRIKLYDEQKCNRCPLLEQRHSFECDPCSGFKADIKLWQEKTIKGKDYIAIPPGDISRFELLFNIKLKDIDDRRPSKKLKPELKFIGKLFDGNPVGDRKTVDQKKLVEQWIEKGASGTICSPPRTGKTVMGAYGICRINTRAIIVADKDDLLEQFLTTFIGDGKKKKPMVNIAALQEETGKPVIGIIKKAEDLLKYDIALLTYQKFIKEKTAINRIKKLIRGRFPMLVVDECHACCSPAFSKFISRLDCKFRLGLSATLQRKDGRSDLLRHLIGPQAAKATTVAVVPKISVFETGFRSTYQHKLWVYAMLSLAKSKPRTDMIVKQIFVDYEAGHKGIIIPVDYKKQAKELSDLVNKAARNKGYDFKFSDVFQAGCDRKKMLAAVDTGKLPVLIAIRSMVKQGIDVALPSMIYIVVPMSAAPNVGAPMFYQLSNRVSSYSPGKIQPEIRIFVDGMGASSGCFKSLFLKEIRPKLINGKDGEKPFYKMEKEEYDRAMMLLSSRSYQPINPVGVYWSSAKILKKLGKNSGKGLFGGGARSRRG